MEGPAPTRARKGFRQVLLVAAVLLGVIVVWGLSMWAISSSFKRTAIYLAQERAQRRVLVSFVRQARELGLTCEEAFRKPEARFKPVLWRVEEAGPGGHCDGRPNLRFVWSNPEEAERRIDRALRSRFTVAGLVLATPQGQKPLKLQYLGSWEER